MSNTLVTRDKLLPYGRQTVDRADIEAVIQALQADLITTGPLVSRFETAFAEYVGAQHAVVVSNGTAALHAAAFAAGVGPGDEVITTPMTFAASANCARYLGADVVFADVRSDTLSLDPNKVRDAITPRTKAIVSVDYSGLPSDLDELLEIAGKHNIVLIEDAAHALGASYRGRRVGSIGHLTTFSLHPVKQITTGEGGVITTNDAERAARMRRFRNHGITSDHAEREKLGSWYYEMTDLGFNYRLTDFQCALGLSQLTKLDGWLQRRREIARAYSSAFSTMEEIELPAVLEDRESAWHLYVIRLRLERLTVGRGDVFQDLRRQNIGVNVHYIPVPWHPYYQKLGFRRGDWSVAEEAYERLITLPMFPAMSDSDVQDVVHAVQATLARFRR